MRGDHDVARCGTVNAIRNPIDAGLIEGELVALPHQRQRHLRYDFGLVVAEVLDGDLVTALVVVDHRKRPTEAGGEKHRRLGTTLADRQLEFPPKLFHLLEMLASEPDQAFGAEEILKRVWADAQYASANDVRQSIYRLRRRLNQLQPGLGECIINIKGFGYRLDIERIPHPPEHEVASLV